MTASASVDLPRAQITRKAAHEVEGAFVLGPDAGSSYAAFFGEDSPDAIDDALGSCLPGDGLHDGAVVRLITTEEHRIVAIEYAPPGARPLRLYAFAGHDAHGYFDETGQRGCGAGWRRPLAELRRTSRFNPKRMHPILHRLRPHEGTDFGAAKGTPVYASYRGVVDWAGPHGSHGTWISIIHPDGIETGSEILTPRRVQCLVRLVGDPVRLDAEHEAHRAAPRRPSVRLDAKATASGRPFSCYVSMPRSIA